MLAVVAVAVMILLGIAAASRAPEPAKPDERLNGAFRREPGNGGTYTHPERRPREIGFQHGYLLAAEIQDMRRVFALEYKHDSNKDWNFFRGAGKNVLWPHIDTEYREELEGIADGLNAKGVRFDVWDVVALNASQEWGYYV